MKKMLGRRKTGPDAADSIQHERCYRAGHQQIGRGNAPKDAFHDPQKRDFRRPYRCSRYSHTIAFTPLSKSWEKILCRSRRS